MFILQNEGQGQKAICTVRKDGPHSLKQCCCALLSAEIKNALAKKISEEIGVRDMKYPNAQFPVVVVREEVHVHGMMM